ncbi:hypothetical protein NQ314_009876 [Rhamnusium bicolor]|uniref:Uncharacterized protein n=1 Tax=Rhamnusium bicolor TaxID=1586634 RepID=A0AAV8XVG7_9CUCU|nr:hypothetical protein NQ314_009876 [Rhamnusium bicolor]
MREECNGGAVVAAVVAVLEKQSLNGTKQFSTTSITLPLGKKDPSLQTEHSMQDENKSTCSNSNSKNSHCLDDQISFELAVKDFNSVAEDVQKICATDSLKRTRDNTKTDIQNQCSFHDVEINGSCNHNELNQQESSNSDITDGDVSSDSDSSDSDEEREHVISEGLATITEELSSAHSYQGRYCFISGYIFYIYFIANGYAYLSI